jgi:hypothetical protein
MLREGFLLLLKQMGTDCHADGETRKALISKHKETSDTVFKFAEECSIQAGDVVRNQITEETFTVVSVRPVSAANAFHHFEVVAMRG